MNLEQQVYYSCAAWSTIHQNRAAVLNHLFCVLGNGYEWENGALVEICGETTTKSGKRLSVQAAINKVFRERRKRNEFKAAYERKRKQEAKHEFDHKRDCPIITRCSCGTPKDHTKWCAKNFDPKDGDVLRCDCGAQARIDEHRKMMASIDVSIEKAMAEMAKRSPEERDAQVKKSEAALKDIKRRIRNDRRYEYRVPNDIKKRIKATDFDHWYPISMDYPSNLANFPDDIQDEWLEGIIETATLIAESYGRFEREGGPVFTNYGAHHDPDGSYAKRATRETYVVANFALHRANEIKMKRQQKKQNLARKRAHAILDAN